MSRLGRGQGIAVVDLGAYPGSGDATLVISDQPDILTTAVVLAWLAPVATGDHSIDEHRVEMLLPSASTIVAGVGFTLSLVATAEGQCGTWSVGWLWANP